MSECIEYDIIIRRTRDYPVVVDVCFSPNVITNRRTFYYERYPSEAETVKVEQSLAERLEKLERRVDDICNVLREPSKPKCAHCGRAAVPQSYRTVAGCKVCETCYRRVTIR